MKPILLLIACLLCCLTHLIAQDEIPVSDAVPKKQIPSFAAIRLNSGTITKGWLYKVNDSQIVVLHARKSDLKRLDDPKQNWDAHTSILAVDQIKSVSVNRKNAGLKGMLLGFAAGAFTGAIIGFALGDDKIQPAPDPATDPYGIGAFFTGFGNSFAMTAGEKALLGGVGLGVGGAIIGGIIGGVAKKKFIIGGKKEKYHDLEGELMRRLVTK